MMRTEKLRQFISNLAHTIKPRKPAAEDIQQEKTLKQLLDSNGLTRFQSMCLFKDSPAKDGNIEHLLGFFLIAAYKNRTPLAETGVEVSTETARGYIRGFALAEGKPLENLFVYDEKNPRSLKLGPVLAEFVRERAAEKGVTLE